jgi:hypothetical protein
MPEPGPKRTSAASAPWWIMRTGLDSGFGSIHWTASPMGWDGVLATTSDRLTQSTKGGMRRLMPAWTSSPRISMKIWLS